MKNLLKRIFLIGAYICILSGFTLLPTFALELTNDLANITQSHNQRAGRMEQQKAKRIESWQNATDSAEPSAPSSLGSTSSQPASRAVSTTTTGPRLLKIRKNGTVSGSPSYVIECSWGRKTILRKGNMWTDGTGYSYSERTWSLSLQNFADKLCKRQT